MAYYLRITLSPIFNAEANYLVNLNLQWGHVPSKSGCQLLSLLSVTIPAFLLQKLLLFMACNSCCQEETTGSWRTGQCLLHTPQMVKGFPPSAVETMTPQPHEPSRRWAATWSPRPVLGCARCRRTWDNSFRFLFPHWGRCVGGKGMVKVERL